MVNRWFDLGLCFMLSGFTIGCGAKESAPVETGPSYSELVITYNSELETLDRLEARREKLVATFEETSLAISNESANPLSQLEELLESAKSINEGTASDLPTDPNELLDSLSKRNGDATEIAEQLLGGLLGGSDKESAPDQRESTPEEKAAADERKATFDADLARLDQELSKQNERVTRAKNARDARETK